MPLRVEPDTFRDALRNQRRSRPAAGRDVGVLRAARWWPSSAPGPGLDWLLIDAEHSPNGLESVLAQLQAVHGYPVHALVRPPVNDTVLIKQYLDLGVQNLLVPMVNSAAEAEAAVAATRYPPHGRPRRRLRAGPGGALEPGPGLPRPRRGHRQRHRPDRIRRPRWTPWRTS